MTMRKANLGTRKKDDDYEIVEEKKRLKTTRQTQKNIEYIGIKYLEIY